MTYSDSSSMSVALNVPNKVFGPMGTGVAGDPGGLPLLLDTGSNQTVTSAGDISGRYAADLSAKEQQNGQAVAIRHAAETMDAVQAKLGEMRKTLETVVKQYPPYPLDSVQRAQYLNSIPALHKQIEALTVPSEQAWYGTKDVTSRTAPSLGIPTVDANSSDAQVAHALDKVDSAVSVLRDKQAGLISQTGISASAETAALSVSQDLRTGLSRRGISLQQSVGRRNIPMAR